MSRRGELTPGQRGLLDRLSASELAASFYLTGGTALSAFHLHHRDSLDLDLFSRRRFDPKQVVRWLNAVAQGAIVPHRAGDRYEFTVPVGGERKFGWPALEHLLQTALLKVERLTGWPETDPPTTLDEGRSFFRDVVRTMIRVDDDVIEPVKPRPPEAT